MFERTVMKLGSRHWAKAAMEIGGLLRGLLCVSSG